MATLLVLLGGAVLLTVACCDAQSLSVDSAEVAAAFTPQQLGDLDFGKYMPKMNITDSKALPCARPKPYRYPRTLKMANFNITKNPISGAVIWTYKHDLIKGVTADMVLWMWENIIKSVKDPRDGKTYSMYLLMHPTDHVGVTWNTQKLIVSKFGEPADGTQWVLSEIPSSGCIATDNTTINCPSKFPGYTCNTDVAELNKRPTFNLTMYDAELRKRGKGPRVIRMRYFFNAKDSGIVQSDLWISFVEFLHLVTPTPRGLSVTTTHTTGWDSSLGKAINEPYMEPVWTAATGGNWQQACLYYALHTMQEWAMLPQWLPAVYKATTGKAG